MTSRRARVLGLFLVLLPVLYLVLWNLAKYMPTGFYPYSVLEQWVIGIGEVAIIVGIAMVLGSGGRWRLAGVLIVGIPVVYVGASQLIFMALPNWAALATTDKAVMVAGILFVALGFFLQLATPSTVASRLFRRKRKAARPNARPMEQPEQEPLS